MYIYIYIYLYTLHTLHMLHNYIIYSFLSLSKASLGLKSHPPTSQPPSHPPPGLQTTQPSAYQSPLAFPGEQGRYRWWLEENSGRFPVGILRGTLSLSNVGLYIQFIPCQNLAQSRIILIRSCYVMFTIKRRLQKWKVVFSQKSSQSPRFKMHQNALKNLHMLKKNQLNLVTVERLNGAKASMNSMALVWVVSSWLQTHQFLTHQPILQLAVQSFHGCGLMSNGLLLRKAGLLR